MKSQSTQCLLCMQRFFVGSRCTLVSRHASSTRRFGSAASNYCCRKSKPRFDLCCEDNQKDVRTVQINARLIGPAWYWVNMSHVSRICMTWIISPDRSLDKDDAPIGSSERYAALLTSPTTARFTSPTP